MKVLKVKPTSPNIASELGTIPGERINTDSILIIKRQIDPTIVKILRDEIIDFILKKLDIKYNSDELALAIEQLSMVYYLCKLKEIGKSDETGILVEKLITILDK